MSEESELAEAALALDDVVHQKSRLGILAIVHEGRKVEFSYLQGALDLTAGNLSQHLNVLEKNGLVHLEKGYEGRRARTWVKPTKTGTRALRNEIASLKAIVDRVDTK